MRNPYNNFTLLVHQVLQPHYYIMKQRFLSFLGSFHSLWDIFCTSQTLQVWTVPLYLCTAVPLYCSMSLIPFQSCPHIWKKKNHSGNKRVFHHFLLKHFFHYYFFISYFSPLQHFYSSATVSTWKLKYFRQIIQI